MHPMEEGRRRTMHCTPASIPPSERCVVVSPVYTFSQMFGLYDRASYTDSPSSHLQSSNMTCCYAFQLCRHHYTITSVIYRDHWGWNHCVKVVTIGVSIPREPEHPAGDEIFQTTGVHFRWSHGRLYMQHGSRCWQSSYVCIYARIKILSTYMCSGSLNRY